MRIAVFALLVSVAGAGGVAQPLPDFAGRWVLVGASGDPSDLARTLTIQPTTVDADMSERPTVRSIGALAVSREIDGVVRTETLQVGTEGGGVGGMRAGAARPVEQNFWSVRWADDCLVSHADSSLGPGSGEVRAIAEQWCMNPARQLVVTLRRARSGSAPVTATRVYRRQ